MPPKRGQRKSVAPAQDDPSGSSPGVLDVEDTLAHVVDAIDKWDNEGRESLWVPSKIVVLAQH